MFLSATLCWFFPATPHKILHLPQPLVNEKPAAEIDPAQVASPAGWLTPSADWRSLPWRPRFVVDNEAW